MATGVRPSTPKTEFETESLSPSSADERAPQASARLPEPTAMSSDSSEAQWAISETPQTKPGKAQPMRAREHSKAAPRARGAQDTSIRDGRLAKAYSYIGAWGGQQR